MKRKKPVGRPPVRDAEKHKVPVAFRLSFRTLNRITSAAEASALSRTALVEVILRKWLAANFRDGQLPESEKTIVLFD